PNLFLLRPGINELELSVRYPTILGIHSGRFRSVALADDLDESVAGVDLVAEYLAEIAGFGPEDFLNHRRVAQPRKDLGDTAARLAELRRDARDEDGRLVHGFDVLRVHTDVILYIKHAHHSITQRCKLKAAIADGQRWRATAG